MAAAAVVAHTRAAHALVESGAPPDRHTNFVEVTEADLGDDNGNGHGSAWAPTMLAALGTAFFFETWRSTDGIWCANCIPIPIPFP